MSDIRKVDLERESKRPKYHRCVVCGVLLKGQTKEFRVDEGKWMCFECHNRPYQWKDSE